MRTLFAFIVCLFPQLLSAQEIFSERIKGLRVFGKDETHLPIASLENDPITIEFDVTDASPPDLYLKFFHCDTEWRKTENLFINDPSRNRTLTHLPYRTAPDGVQYYRFQYSLKLPFEPYYPRFFNSGNHLFEIWDGKKNMILARGRFFVAERRLQPVIRIHNRLRPAETSPTNQTLRVDAMFQIPEPDSINREYLYSQNFRTVDVYRNREIMTPRQINIDDYDPDTFVGGIATRKLTFSAIDVRPGNEYRRLDLRNIDYYPAGRFLRQRDGADVSRFLQRADRDQDGASYVRGGDRYSDYLNYQFELLWDASTIDAIYVVGDFNGWQISEEGRMAYEGGRYIWKTWLRRGLYDYQYVLREGDWVSLEGNDWRAVSNYTVIVYYRDTRFGGFDRILGAARARNKGSAGATIQ